MKTTSGTTAYSIKVSVIIPYFQREQGILHRALASIVRQNLPPYVMVDVIVVDDGSPVPAHLEVKGLLFKPPFRLIIIPQVNSGVAAARNTGLEVLDDTSRYIAFLDSDDSWHEDHLRQGIEALERGHDFYFCDNKRERHHESNFALGQGLIAPYIEKAGNVDFITISEDELATIILRDCPAQASTIIYRRDIAPDLLFDISKKRAGEDLTFFMQLLSRVQNACFSPKTMVNCGNGVNIYFNHLGWDSEGNLCRIIDNLRAHRTIQEKVMLSKDNTIWNNRHIAKLGRAIAFHALRKIIKKRTWPSELRLLIAEEKWFRSWLVVYTVQVALGRAFRLYRPD